ncbi:MAG: phosphatase PAP2 family protein [Lachnospiraceae bacterium]|nr:phosphatase PAP2 family protein [Lachnospiraceae bacterium]
MKKIITKYGHIWTVLYALIYMPWFAWLEKSVKTYTLLHTRLDDMIPFCEYFIIPYILWFAYVPIVMIYVFFTSKKEFYKASAYLFIGMTICLTICTIWPNGQDLRMDIINNNIFSNIVKVLYTTDTNTNVFPSIHVFNSIGVFLILCKSERMKDRYFIKISSFILTFLIILSTMFLKQHSVLDVLGGIVLGAVMYMFVYAIDYSKVFQWIKEGRFNSKQYERRKI